MLGRHYNTRLLHLQPTPFCNLDCSYCYLPGRDQQAVMATHIPGLALGRLRDAGCLGSQLDIGWHAGEPLVLPVAYYEKTFDAIDSSRPAELSVNHHFQTNATRITDDFCRFAKARKAAVSVSVDGPEHIHDSNRRTRAGTGSHKAVMRGIERLQANAVRFSVIAVLTRAALEDPDAIFEFFVANGIERVCFNLEEIEGVHGTTSLNHTDAPIFVRLFFERYIELLRSGQSQQWVREIDGRLRLLFKGVASERAQNEPLSIVSVNWKGDMSTFSPELLGIKHPVLGGFTFANVMVDAIDDILRNEKYLTVNAEIQQGVSECEQTCHYFSVCGGGAPSNKLAENGTFASTETTNCRLSIKVVTDLLLDLLETASICPELPSDQG